MDSWLGWQIEVLRWIETWRNPFFDQLFLLLTKLGEEEIVIVLLGWLYWNWNKLRLVKLTYAVSWVLLLSIGLKDLFDIPRPFDFDPSLTTARDIYLEEVEAGLGYAFPSGHSTIAAAWTAGIASLSNKKWMWIAAGILMTLVGLSRMYLGVHYPLDVIAGLTLGVFVVIAGQRFFACVTKDWIRWAAPLLIWLVLLPFGLGEDFYKSLGLYIGFVAGTLLEQKYELLLPVTKNSMKWLRFGIGIVMVLAVQQGLKLVFPEGDLFFAAFRYLLVGLTLFAGAPAVYKTFRF